MLRPLFHKLDRDTRIHKFDLVRLATLRGDFSAVHNTVDLLAVSCFEGTSWFEGDLSFLAGMATRFGAIIL